MDYPRAIGMVSTASSDPAPIVPEYNLDDLGNLVLSSGLTLTFPDIFSVGEQAYGGPSQIDDDQEFNTDGSSGLLEEGFWAPQQALDYDQNGDIEDLRRLASHQDGWTFQDDHVVSENVVEGGLLHENGPGGLDEKCQRDMFESVGLKCYCGICTSRAFMSDIDTLGFNIPEVNHVFSYQDPEDNMEVDEPTPLPQYERAVDQTYSPLSPGDRHHETSTRLPLRKKKKNKRKVPDRAAEEMLELLVLSREAFESNSTLPEESLNRLRQLTSGIKPLQQSSTSLITEPKRADPEIFLSDRMSASLHQSTPFDTHTASRGDLIPRARPTASLHMNRSVTIRTRQEDSQTPRSMHHCTFPSCTRSYHRKSDWKRHEKSVHQKQRYMCGNCSPGHDHPLGGYACDFCMSHQRFPSLGSVKIHTIRCSEAKNLATSYSRIDHLRDHIRDEHGIEEVQDDSFDWVFEGGLDDGWLRECGFCGDNFDDFEDRADHISDHYKEGREIEDWRVPFQQEAESQFGETSPDTSDDSEDENQEDDNENDEDRDKYYDEDTDESDSNDDGDDGPANRPSRSHGLQPPADSYNTQNGITNYTGHAGATMLPGRNNYTNTTAEYGDDLYGLRSYLASEEQHERLILGIGRRPMHVIIGQRRRMEPARASPNTSSQRGDTSLPLHSETLSGSRDIPDPREAEVVSSSLDSPQTCTALQIRYPAWRQGPLTGRVPVYILDQQQPYTLGYSPVLASLLARQNHSNFILGNELQAIPLRTRTVSSASSIGTLTTHSRTSKSWHSSLASTVDTHGVVPWHIQVVDDADTIGRVIQDLDDQMWWLPCEFAFNGCDIRFPPSRYADWVAHSLSHFLGKLPRKAICWFCDEQEGTFEAHDNLVSTWATRMQHISMHLEMGLSVEEMRPDYWLMEHLWNTGLLAAEVYQSAVQYSERPACTGLMPLGHETEAMLRKRERDLQQLYDLVKEKRQRKGNKAASCLSSQKSHGIGHQRLENQNRVIEMSNDQDVMAQDGNTNAQPNSTTTFSLIPRKYQDNDEQLTGTGLGSHEQARLMHTEQLTPSDMTSCLEPQKDVGAASTESLLPMSPTSLESSGSLSISSSVTYTKSPSTFSDLTSLSASESSNSSRKNCSTKSRKRPANHLYPKPIVHSRDSSIASIYSKSSSENQCASSLMGGESYKISSSFSNDDSDKRIERRRVPDNSTHYMTSTTSRSGKVQVHAHQARYYDPQEPRASEARSEDYQRSENSKKSRR